jgi:heme exporter protein D
MHFEDIGSFFDMGGYGLYVWLSFGASFLSILILWVDTFFSKRTFLMKVLNEQTRQARIKAAAEQTAKAGQTATARQGATAGQRTNGEII